MQTSRAHLFLALSGHGFGHVTQAAPLVNELRRRCPGLHLTVQTAVPHGLVGSRIEGPFDYLQEPPDPGVTMANALDVDRAATVEAYRAFHAGWPGRVAREVRRLQELDVGIVLADVPYLPLAAASRAGIAAVAVCSLNWADIVAHYAGEAPNMAPILAAMRRAYGGADLFLRPEPAMPMPWLRRTAAVGPLASVGQRRRDEIVALLGCEKGRHLALVTLGGIATSLPLERWPSDPEIHWLMPPGQRPLREDMTDFTRLPLPFADLLASVDLLIAKPGYGTFVEAACAGLPTAYVARGDWPEEPYLCHWLRRHVPSSEIPRDAWQEGAFLPRIRALLGQPVQPAQASGAPEAADLIQAANLIAG